MVAKCFQNYFEKYIIVHCNSRKVICESYILKHECHLNLFFDRDSGYNIIYYSGYV